MRAEAIRDLRVKHGRDAPVGRTGGMAASPRGESGPDDEPMTTIATVCDSNDVSAVRDLYTHEDLSVPSA